MCSGIIVMDGASAALGEYYESIWRMRRREKNEPSRGDDGRAVARAEAKAKKGNTRVERKRASIHWPNPEWIGGGGWSGGGGGSGGSGGSGESVKGLKREGAKGEKGEKGVKRCWLCCWLSGWLTD
jgi:hypothetical protein